MTYADSGTKPLGMSRTTPHTARTPVRLAIWGLTDADAAHAIYRARDCYVGARLWDITTIDRLPGDTCPIRSDDPGTLATGSDYHYAWAAYPANRDQEA